MIKYLLAPVLASIVTSTACKTPGADKGSTIKHVFGNTWVNRATPPEPCKNKNAESPQGQYVNALIDYITSKNPDTFKGNIDRKYICVQIESRDELSAAMQPTTGSMRIFPALLRAKGFETDASYAAVVSHELAHFSMGHHLPKTTRPLPRGYDKNKELAIQARIDAKKAELLNEETKLIQDFVNEGDHQLESIIRDIAVNDALIKKMNTKSFPTQLQNAYQEFMKNPKYDSASSLLGEIDTWVVQTQIENQKRPGIISDETAESINSLLTRRESLRTALDPKHQQLYKIQQELEDHRLPVTQQEEQEADEVGFELYVRAGFEPKLFGQTFVSLAKARNPNLNCLQITAKTSEPPRYRDGISFDRVHPDFCWRYFDLKYTERQKHATDYAQFTPKIPIVNLPQLNQLRGPARAR